MKTQICLRAGMTASMIAILVCPAVIAAPAIAAQAEARTAPTRAERLAVRRAAREARRAERREARRRALAAASGVTAPDREGSATVEGGDIVVTGLRESVGKSIATKRRARQIVDVVTAEDAGKLPDNNVVEAMARITGITVTRSGGRADGFNIRGLAGVQTTINGTEGATAPLPFGEGRTLNLESVPAELVKSIEVYKTRTADQIEGGIGGSVNIELRRPLDLRKGWTTAASYRNTYAEQGNLWSPSGSVLIANRFETGIGEVGFLLNGAYVKQRYAEANNNSESPFSVGAPGSRIRLSLPADTRDTLVTPYRASYGTNDGSREQKSLSGALQWQAADKLNFVLEGSYSGEDYSDQDSSLYVRLREDYYVLQNVRIAPSGVLLGFDISNPPLANGTRPNFGNIAAGFDGGENRGETENYRTNFEAHYADDGLRIDGSVQYQWSDNDYHRIGHGGSYLGLSSVRVDLDSPKVLGGGPFFQFNVSPTDPGLARVQYLSDNLGHGDNSQFSAQVDVWKELDADGFLRAGRFGGRYSKIDTFFRDSYRFAGYFPPELSLPTSAIPGVSTISVTPELPGGSPLSWVQLNNRQLYDNWGQVIKFIAGSEYEFLDGPGRDAGAAALFATEKPSAGNAIYTSASTENSFAAYGTLDYAFKALFPIEGNVGLRYVNTWASINGAGIRLGTPLRDPTTGLLTGEFGPDSTDVTAVRVNYVDLLPSVFGVVHFSDKLQLRASYSRNVQRPSLFLLRNSRVINYRDPNDRLYAGNPGLKPTRTDDYNLSLEWYPAAGSVVSLAAFRKDQTGFIYETAQVEAVPELGGQTRVVVQPRNAGPGRTEGLEAQATGFFRFMPGFLRNLGATVNATWIPTADISLPNLLDREEGDPFIYELIRRRAPFASRWSYNLIGYYETPVFSARLAYNWRSKYQTDVDAINQERIISSYPTKRLDAAINLTPVKYLTLSIEAQNLLRNVDRFYYYSFPELPVGLRAMGRTFTASARVRF
ncbi:TonB-dependent receptor [Sphingomonas sp. 1P08PE]|uniref:TonB-dependent receptor n=1 Tax=Sphingomonas sp. 1P08PE TaxID=554122 RepID=UPI0039A3592A